jgi:starch synthase (maltosyl-transferring)
MAARPMLIYNLFPLLAGPFVAWRKHLERAAALGFTWVFVNPIQRTGKSRSLYAVDGYEGYDPRFLEATSPLTPDAQLGTAMAAARELGLGMMIDLVADHCSVDSDLIKRHPEWFAWEGNGRVARPFCMEDGKKVVWTDLAKFDHRHSTDTEGLYRYFQGVVESLYARGFRAFRCDAAYQVPLAFWSRLIRDTKTAHADALFLAETLGCPLDTTLRLAAAGFDYLFNSLKWWDLRASWFPKHYLLMREVARTVSFPESHDTARLAEELQGNFEACKHRYTLAALFSSAAMMPIGFEFGFRRRLHVAGTRPEDWEATGADLRAHVRRVNAIKADHPIFQEDSPIERHHYGDDNVVVLWKGSANTREEALLIVNRDLDGEHAFHTDHFGWCLQSGGPITDLTPGHNLRKITTPFHHNLRPAEVLVFVGRR